MTPRAALAFIKKHGIVLESARGAVPNLVEAIVGGPLRGSWWAHPEGKRIFAILGEVNDSPDVLRCRLVDGKVTYAHRRVWIALVVLADELGPRRLDRTTQEHTSSGAHRTVTTPFPRWAPTAITAEAKKISREAALAIIAPYRPSGAP